MLVYRVEHRETQKGPYWSDAGLDKTECGATDRTPLHDSLPSGPNWLFGFESDWQLSRWFSVDQRERLARKNFVLVVYEADSRFVISDSRKTQVVFAEAVRVSEMNLSPTEEPNASFKVQ